MAAKKKTAAKKPVSKMTPAAKRKALANYSPTKVGTKLKNVGQTKAGKKIDKEISAMGAGKRVSKSGNVYYERRANRAD